MPAALKYEPFLVLLTSHDAQWSLQSYERGGQWYEPFLRPAREVENWCRRYRGNINANHRRFCKANGKGEGAELARFYYDPIFYLPLGHPDIYSLLLVDDFDPVDAFTAEMTRTLESVSIGFSPDLQSLGTPFNPEVIRKPSAIWNPGRVAGPAGLPPFAVFCKLKMEGLAAVGLGLPFQIAIWRTMVRRISDVAGALERRFGGEAKAGSSPLIEPEDARNTWCSLLDLQGCEEVGLLVFSTNLSAAFSIIGGVRTLTFNDVFRAEEGLVEKLALSRMHRIVSRYVQARGAAPKEDVTRLGYGHVFRWSHSAIGVAPERNFKLDARRLFAAPERLHGYVAARSRLQIPPGHVARSRDRVLVPLREPPAGNVPPSISLPGDCFPYLAGLYDSDLEHGPCGLAEAGQEAVLAGLVIDNIERTFERLCRSRDARQWRGRDVIDLETDVIVPLPKLVDEAGQGIVYCRVDPGHFAPLGKLLPKMVHRLCRSSPGKPGGMNIHALMEAQRRIGVPISLRRALQYAYEDFALLTEDMFYFDVLLDLYDTFATLYAVLTRHLPKQREQLGRCDATGPRGRLLLDETRVMHLSEMLGALHNAMLHRTGNAFRDTGWRDMAMDLRGGLNQILLAADAPMKCGLGVLRRFASEAGTRARAGGRPRDSVGCVLRVGTAPGARCYKAAFGVEKDARLAFFDVDVPHVLHVCSYADYLHEAFHLVFERARDREKEFSQALALADEPTRYRLEEVFAQMLSAMFIFPNDCETFFRHTVLSYSRDVASTGTNDEETVRRFAEVLVRLFLVVYPMQQLTADARYRGDPRRWPERFPAVALDLSRTQERFVKFVEEAGPFFSEYQRLWQGKAGEQVWDSTCAHFRAVFARITPYLPAIWKQTVSVFRLAARHTFPERNKPGDLADADRRIRADVRAALAEGRPLVWSQYRGPGAVRVRSGQRKTVLNYEGDGLDPLPFVCRILHEYIWNIGTAKDHRVHLLRTSDSADVKYEGNGPWWEFQADKGAAALFCCVPAARQTRLLKQIAMLKSFWDVASELRARRLLDMLHGSRLDGRRGAEERKRRKSEDLIT